MPGAAHHSLWREAASNQAGSTLRAERVSGYKIMAI